MTDTRQPRGRPRRAVGTDILARNLRIAREQAGLTLEQLSGHCGVSIDMLGHYEAGAHSPSAHKLYDVAQALGVSMDALFNLDFPKKVVK